MDFHFDHFIGNSENNLQQQQQLPSINTFAIDSSEAESTIEPLPDFYKTSFTQKRTKVVNNVATITDSFANYWYDCDELNQDSITKSEHAENIKRNNEISSPVEAKQQMIDSNGIIGPDNQCQYVYYPILYPYNCCNNYQMNCCDQFQQSQTSGDDHMFITYLNSLSQTIEPTIINVQQPREEKNYNQIHNATSKQSSAKVLKEEINSSADQDQKQAFGTYTASGEKIRRPPNSFMIFAKDRRREILYSNRKMSNKEVSKQLGEEWRNLPLNEKIHYQKLSEQLRSEHQIKYPGYYYSPVEARRRKEEKRLKKISQDENNRLGPKKIGPQ